MVLDEHVEWVEAYYDGECAMCTSFAEWGRKQKHTNRIDFLAYQSNEAVVRFPELFEYEPAKVMIVRTSAGDVYQGAEAWLWCLWSCTKYRKVAQRFTHPLLLAQTEKFCQLLAANRLTVSKLFFGKKSEEIAQELKAAQSIECGDSCEFQK